MRRDIGLLTTLSLIIPLATACGSGAAEEATSEMGAEAPSAGAAPAVASSAALECMVMGDTDGRASPLREVRFTHDGGEGLLCHGAPSARGREIMGGLVPYGRPWRIGANEPTTIHLSAATTVGGVGLEPGSYSLYAIPGESEWEFFINSNYERWGIPINADVRSTEVGSFTATPEATAAAVETLSYEYTDGALVLSWENTMLRIPVGGM